MMTREERLKFCSICKKRQMDMQRGLVCSLTNEYATFDEKCTDFEADETAIAKELTKQREYKEELQKTGGVLTGSNWFLWIGVLSILNIILGCIVNLQFVFGLAVTQSIQGIAVETGTEILGIILSVLISGFYIWTYYLAAKKEHLWAYFAGWSIYLLDALIYLLILPIEFDASIIWPLFLHAILLVVLYSSTPLFNENTWQNIKTFDWTHSRIAYAIYGGMITLIQIGCLVLIGITMIQN